MKKLFAVGLIGISVGMAWGQATNYQTVTLFVYSFTKFVQWPEEVNTGDFEIVVLGNSPVFAELKTMSEKKKVGSRAIQLSKIAGPSEFKKGHILYVSTEWLSKYSEVAGKVGDLPTLIITEHATGTNKGDINFIHKDGKLAFEINSPNLTKHRLKASAELVRFAVTN
ncbi:MAG: YfiR family protein [Bacteroidetes bacterium]|nr:YfiR family protein [Bacteroidota bacterium]MBS1541471.1 YfiR family protein [Bacteroidota bacterium]